MRKITATIILANIFILNLCAEDYKLEAPDAPFKAKTQSRNNLSSKVALNFSGRTITCGSKKLIVSQSGDISFLSNGKDIFRLYYYISTKFSGWVTNKRTDDKVPSPATSRNMGIIESISNPEEKKIIIKSFSPLILPETDKNAKLKVLQEITAQKDGKIKITYTFEAPVKYEKDFKRRALLMELDAPVFAGGKAIVNNKSIMISKMVSRAPAQIHFAPGVASDEFKLDVINRGRVSRIGNKVTIGISPLRSSQTNEKVTYMISLLLDPMGTEVEANDGKRYAGIDFKQIDDLTVPDYSDCRNLIQNPSFEQGRLFLYQHYPCLYEAVDDYKIDSEQARFGKHSLKLHNSQDKLTSFPFFLSGIPAYPGTYTLSFYSKSDTPEKVITNIRIRTGGNQTLSSKAFKATRNWKRHSLTFKINKLCSIAPTFECKIAANRIIWIDGVQLERGNKATDFVSRPIEGLLVSSRKDNFFTPNDKINARLRLNTQHANVRGKVSVNVKDFFGKIRFKKILDFNTGKNGTVELPLNFENCFTRGIYIVHAQYELESNKTYNDFFRFSIMDFMNGKHKNRQMFSNSYGGHFGHDAHPGLESYLKRCMYLGVGSQNSVGWPTQAYTNLLRKFGIAVVNMDVFDVVRSNGIREPSAKERFRIYDRCYYAKDAEILLRDFNVEGSGTIDQAYIDKMEKAVAEKIKLYPGAEYYGILGESFAKYRDWAQNDFKSFVDIRVFALKAIQKAGKKIVNAAVCNMNPQNGTRKIESMLKAYDGRIKFDAINCHTYLSDGPYALENNIQVFLDMIVRYGYGNTPVFFPEGIHYGPYKVSAWGVRSASWSAPGGWFGGTLSYDMGWTEKRSAAWIARSWLICMKYMKQVFSASSGVQNMVNNFQLDIDMTPRAYQKIVNTLSRLLGDANFVRDVSFAADCKCLVFEDNLKRPVVALWGKNQKVDFGYEKGPVALLDMVGLEPEVFDLMETRRSVKKNATGKVLAPISSFPFFFRGRPGETEQYCSIFSHAIIHGKNLLPMKLNVKVISPEYIDLTVRNLISQKITGELIVNGKTEKISLDSGNQKHFRAKLSKKLQANRITDNKLSIIMKEKNSEELRSTISFPGFICKKTNTPIKIDGLLNDWKNIPAIQFENKNISQGNSNKKYSKNDFKGEFKVSWNNDYFYVAVNIIDDYFFHENNEHKPGNRWNNDSLQIFIDTLCDGRHKGIAGYDTNDYDFAVFPNPSGNGSRVFRYLTVDCQLALGINNFKDNVFEPGIKSAFKRTEKGYIYEVAFPSKYILPVRLEKDYAIGLGLYVNDRDAGKSVKQSLTLSPSGTGCYMRPDLYPIMLFSE